MKELGAGNSDVAAVKDGHISTLQELNEALRAEIEALKENSVWIKKDNKFKAEQLNIFLADCGAKNTQLFELRKKLVETKAELATKTREISELNEQLA